MTDSTWAPFRLSPDDLLFFRDGQPSTIGADHYLRSVFPPYPGTLYGAIRARRLMDEGVDPSRFGPDALRGLGDDVKAELGEWGGVGNLELRGPWIVRTRGSSGSRAGGLEVLLPAPSDLALVMAAPEHGGCTPDSETPRVIDRVLRLRITEDHGTGGHSHALALMALHDSCDGAWEPWDDRESESKPQSASGHYLTELGMSKWMRGGIPEPEHIVHRDQLWVDEVRTGVGLDPSTRIHSEGMLYTFGYIRFKQGVGLGFEVRNSGLAPERAVRIGGEARTGWLDQGPPFPLTEAPSAGGRFAVTFLTPALSECGGLPPGGFSPDQPEGLLNGVKCRLLGACVRAHVPIGGWDASRGTRGGPKALRRAIPAGSVFIFERTEPSTAGSSHSLSGIHAANISDYADEAAPQQGFGLAITGSY